MTDLVYEIYIEPLPEDEGGGFMACVPDLPGCTSDGDTPEAALEDLRHAIDAWAMAQKKRGRKMPKPGSAMEGATKQYEELRSLLKKQSELLQKQTSQILALSEELEALKTRRRVATPHQSVGSGGWIVRGTRTPAAVAVLPTRR